MEGVSSLPLIKAVGDELKEADLAAGHWRKFLWFFLGLGAGFLLLLGLTAILLQPDQVRDLVADQIRQSTGAQVSLGQASLRLLPSPGIRLGPSRIGADVLAADEPGNPSSGVRSYAVEFDRVDVNVAVLPLFKRVIRIDRLEARGPVLQIDWPEDRLVATNFRLEVKDLVWPTEVDPVVAGQEDSQRVPPGEVIPEDLVFLLNAACDELKIRSGCYTDLVCEGELDTRVLTLSSCRALQSGGRLQASLTLAYDRDPWGELAFEVQAESVPAAALLKPLSADLARRLSCELSGDVVGFCGLQDASTVRQTLDLTGTLAGGPGVLAAADWLKEATPYLGDRQDLTKVRFEALQHAFRISQGRYLVQDLRLSGGDTDWQGQGWVGLTGSLDLELTVKLPTGFTPDLGQWSFLAESLRDEAGRINLGLRLSGRTKRPTVGVDLGALSAARGQKADGALKSGLGGLLDKWQGK